MDCYVVNIIIRISFNQSINPHTLVEEAYHGSVVII
jgi:hypothetical protein